MSRHSLSIAVGAVLGVVLPSLSLAAPAPSTANDELFITATRTPEKLVDVDASILVRERCSHGSVFQAWGDMPRGLRHLYNGEILSRTPGRPGKRRPVH